MNPDGTGEIDGRKDKATWRIATENVVNRIRALTATATSPSYGSVIAPPSPAGS